MTKVRFELGSPNCRGSAASQEGSEYFTEPNDRLFTAKLPIPIILPLAFSTDQF